MMDIEKYQIPVFNFPNDPDQDDAETEQENNELRAMLPFAVVGSDEEINVRGSLVRGRQYPWGIVEGISLA
jgi:cell division control protein 11